MSKQAGAKKILFVCTGNSCRSVMAEALLRDYLERKERTDVQVLSAGTNTMDGIGPTLETVEVMWNEGVDVSHHAGQQLTPELVSHADLILCMEDYHRQQVLEMDPGAEPKVHLLKTFQNPVQLPDPNIPDPIGCSKKVYEMVLQTIKDGVHRLLKWLEDSDKKETPA